MGLEDIPELPASAHEWIQGLKDGKPDTSPQNLAFMVSLAMLREANNPWLGVVCAIKDVLDQNNVDLVALAASSLDKESRTASDLEQVGLMILLAKLCKTCARSTANCYSPPHRYY